MRNQDKPLHFEPEGDFTGNDLNDFKAVVRNGKRALNIAKAQDNKKTNHVWMRNVKTAVLVRPEKVEEMKGMGFKITCGGKKKH